MAERIQDMQDVFLNACAKEKRPVTVYLVNGVKLQGTIGGFDHFSVVLKRNQTSQLVYKHSIATVVPGGSIPVTPQEDAGYAPSEDFEEDVRVPALLA